MIALENLRVKAARLWAPALAAHLAARPDYFPYSVPFDHKPEPDFSVHHRRVEELVAAQSSPGLRIEFCTVDNRTHGRQTLPAQLLFDSIEDLAAFLGREDDLAPIRQAFQVATAAFPSAAQDLSAQPLKLAEAAPDLPKLLELCACLASPDFTPGQLMLRELPLSFDTKFIEQHARLVRWAIQTLAPHCLREGPTLEAQLGCLTEAPRVRLRFLDYDPAAHGPYSDLEVPISELATARPDASRVLIVENKTTFLVLPPLAGTMALFGQGFAVTRLRYLPWLQEKDLLYWGDIDVQGFQILSQLRDAFPCVKSIAMDLETLNRYATLAVEGVQTLSPIPSNLSPDELLCFNHCLTHNARIEQERIPPTSVIEAMK